MIIKTDSKTILVFLKDHIQFSIWMDDLQTVAVTSSSWHAINEVDDVIDVACCATIEDMLSNQPNIDAWDFENELYALEGSKSQILQTQYLKT